MVRYKACIIEKGRGEANEHTFVRIQELWSAFLSEVVSDCQKMFNTFLLLLSSGSMSKTLQTILTI